MISCLSLAEVDIKVVKPCSGKPVFFWGGEWSGVVRRTVLEEKGVFLREGLERLTWI